MAVFLCCISIIKPSLSGKTAKNEMKSPGLSSFELSSEWDFGSGGGGGGELGWKRVVVTHHGPMTGRGVSKGGQIRVRLDAAPDAGQGFEKPDSRMATLWALPWYIFLREKYKVWRVSVWTGWNACVSRPMRETWEPWVSLSLSLSLCLSLFPFPVSGSVWFFYCFSNCPKCI